MSAHSQTSAACSATDADHVRDAYFSAVDQSAEDSLAAELAPPLRPVGGDDGRTIIRLALHEQVERMAHLLAAWGGEAVEATLRAAGPVRETRIAPTPMESPAEVEAAPHDEPAPEEAALPRDVQQPTRHTRKSAGFSATAYAWQVARQLFGRRTASAAA